MEIAENPNKLLDLTWLFPKGEKKKKNTFIILQEIVGKVFIWEKKLNLIYIIFKEWEIY